MRIVTVTMNPAIDKSSIVQSVVADRKLRCAPPTFEPGGGGINVSRAIQRLGGESLTIYPAGGSPGRLFQELLDAEEMRHHPIAVKGWTRENLMIYEERTNRQFRFGMPGAELTDKEWRMCLAEIFQLDSKPDFIVASGSLPPGAPQNYYGRMAHECQRRGINLIVDTSGDALRQTIEETPIFLMKPNLRELTALAGKEIEDESQQEATTRSLIEKGRSRYVVVSLGAAGVLAVSAKGVSRIPAPEVAVKSKVGAGDSTVAGITLALAQGKTFMDAVKFGAAAGAAAVMTPGSELCRRTDVEKLYQDMP